MDEIAIIKQIIAKEHPVILEGELRQQEELPTIPEDETDLITKEAHSVKNSMSTEEEKDENDDELLNLSPSILNNDNAHSAFEISTIEYV